MDFKRRLRLFIFGVLLGSFVVWGFLFRGRDLPAWTPEGRVLEELQKNPVKISSLAKCKSACYEITEADILQVLGTADVKFSESNIRDKDVPEYVLEGKGVNGETHKLLFRIEYMSSYLLDILPEDDRKDCNCGN